MTTAGSVAGMLAAVDAESVTEGALVWAKINGYTHSCVCDSVFESFVLCVCLRVVYGGGGVPKIRDDSRK